MKAVNQLQDKRDMSINECKLTIAIEDPRSRERREAMGIEVSPASITHILLGSCTLWLEVLCPVCVGSGFHEFGTDGGSVPNPCARQAYLYMSSRGF